MTSTGDISEATRLALEALHQHAQTQHELMKTIPLKPTALGRGMVEFEVTLPDLFADGESIHGALFTILLDTILATAAWTKLDTFMPLATINLKTDFFTPAPPGTVLTIKGICHSISDDVAFCQGTAVGTDGVTVAQADGTFMVGTANPAVTESRL